MGDRGADQEGDEMSKVWFVTGAARGMGNAIVNAVLQHGDCVIATSRKGDDIPIPDEYKENTLCLKLDISDSNEEIYAEAVDKAAARFGRIDVLVNNAGYGAVTFFEETKEETIKKLYETNVFGTMRVTRAVLPVMRKQRSGHIFNISSTASYAPGPVIYHSSKFAVTGFSVALAFEVEPFGIRVTNVAPGMFRTNFYDAGKWGTEADMHIDDYDACRWQPGLVADCQKHLQPGDPMKLAEVIIKAAESENPPLHLGVGEDAPDVMYGFAEKIKADTDAWREVASDTSFEK